MVKNNWLIKIQNQKTNRVISVYDDGFVYGNDKGYKIGKLNECMLLEVKNLIKKDLTFIKDYTYFKQNSDGFIVKFWDCSRKKRLLKVKGWRYGEEVYFSLLRTSNYNSIIDEDRLSKEVELFFGEL